MNNLSLCSTADASNVTRALLRGVFNLGADLDHLLLVLPDGSSKVDDLLSRYFVLAPVSVPGNWSVFLCSRQNFVSTLYVRSARVEDHDDLATVFESQSEVVAERFGTFFLSEQIESQSQKNRVLVGEGSDGRAVGLLSASTDVPTELLQKCFETTPYGHLVTRSELLRAYDARGTVLASRQSVDWLSVLGVHSDELPAVFDAIPHVDCAGTSLMATFIYNRVPPTKQIPGEPWKSPLALQFPDRKAVDLTKIQPFGLTCWVHQKTQIRDQGYGGKCDKKQQVVKVYS